MPAVAAFIKMAPALLALHAAPAVAASLSDAADRAVAALDTLRPISRRVADETRVNGIRLEIRHLSVGVSPSAVGTLLRQRWADGPGELDEQRVGEWLVLGRQRGSFHETWQIRMDGGLHSEVVYSVSDVLHAPTRPAASPFALPGGTRIISVVESSDRGRRAVQHLVHAPLPPRRLLDWVRNSAAARGWLELSPGTKPETDSGFVSVHGRAGSELTVVALGTRDGSRLVINQVQEIAP
jgi:hypothetical protein